MGMAEKPLLTGGAKASALMTLRQVGCNEGRLDLEFSYLAQDFS
jgi:hypothetical protein